MPFRECRLGMVAGPHPFTADAGLEILRAGGTAFDAVVAAAFTEGIVQPAHNGVGGYGGAAVCYIAAERRVDCIDFNTEAPAAARPDMFPTAPVENGVYEVPGAIHRHGGLSIGIPGIVAGLAEIHRCWGTLPLPRLLQPAIRAARDGWPCNTPTSNSLKENGKAIAHEFPVTAALLMPDGRAPEPHETMRNPDLAATLERLAAAGARDFYEGETARRIVEAVRADRGILELEDMRRYQARHVPTTRTEHRGKTLHTAPVGCGGVTSFQIVQVMETFDLGSLRPGTTPFYHLLMEVMKACWRRRLLELGDAAFTGVPETTHLEEGMLREIRAEVEEGLRDPRPGVPIAPDPFLCTSHLCAADAAGNVVSLTQTHGAHFGSWLTVPGTGLTLGHGMGRFEPRPGWPNSIAPGKRPMHNMAPILAMDGDRPAAAYGTPGGRTIVNNQAAFSLYLWAYGQDIASALGQPRLHCEEAEPAKLELGAGEAVLEELRALGHEVVTQDKIGGAAHGIVIGGGPTDLDGATDHRWEGKVAWA